MDKIILTVTIGVSVFIIAREGLRALMASWHEEIVGVNEPVTEDCANYRKDRQFLFWMPILISAVVSANFYLFWYQYLPR